jgi:hypothetical protein
VPTRGPDTAFEEIRSLQSFRLFREWDGGCGSPSLSGRQLNAGVNKLEATEPETQRTGAEQGWNRGGVGGPTVVGSNVETNGDAKLFETQGCAREPMPLTKR